MHPNAKDRKLLVLAVIATLFSIGHHIDHIVRGNHVGWPLIPQITPFTVSLGFYPVIALGFYLYIRGRVGPRFWAILSILGVLFVGLLHFGLERLYVERVQRLILLALHRSTPRSISRPIRPLRLNNKAVPRRFLKTAVLITV